jgi:ActR/RegA family two-component response regulator
MSDKAVINDVGTGRTLYIVERNGQGQAWNGSAFVTETSTRSTFAIAATEIGSTGHYTATIPGSAGFRRRTWYQQLGGSPATTDTPLAIEDGYWDASLLGATSSVTGSVGSIAAGGIIAASFAAGAIDNAAIATDAIGSAELAASAVSEIQSGLSTIDAAGVRTAIGLGSANLDTQLSAIAGYIDTEVAAIKAKTDNLPSDPADASDIAGAFSTVNSTLSTIAGYIDTEVAAIKAKTDQLTFTTANRVDATSDKAGFKLASDGLDSISITAPAGVATNFREMLVQLWRRFFKKATKTSTQIKTYADNGSTVVTTQTISDDGTTQTQGAGS